MEEKPQHPEVATRSRSYSQGETIPTSVGQYGVPSWASYMPGPSPTYRFRGLSASWARTGIIVCGRCIMVISGYNLALMGSISSLAPYLATVGLADGSKHAKFLVGLINSLYWVGVVVGALFVGGFSDKVGRRRAIVFTGLFAVVVVPVFASLQNFTWALVTRFANGLATGSFDSVGLNWSAETVDPRHRGRTIGFHMSCAAMGAAIAYFIPFGLNKHSSGDVVWRLPLAFQLLFVLVVLCVVCFLPESPRWLVQVGLTDVARDVLLAVKHCDSPEELPALVEIELESVSKTIEMERRHSSSTSYWAMFTVPDNLRTARRTWSAIFVQFATQAMVGSGFVSGYGIQIFETGGWSPDLAALLAGLAIVTQAVFGMPGAIFSDKLGRRKAMIGGAAVGAVILALIGMCGYFVDKHSESNPALAKSYGSATVALVFLWCAVFGATWLWCPFVYPSEIFPAQSRAKGSSVGIVGLGLGSFFASMISPYLFDAIGYQSLFMICGLSFLVAMICYLWMPETAGKTLEEIDGLYD
ncbi:hypothetical protein QIS74_04230 [Colletotrichum tabaci]|uniref:Major facilitator superfamily (MFS) profile domain-containing protein n=1 Tax=Colletotrichum tabaci TaxID=1209068 RepID=A0AAV9TJ44_9PEZI